MGAGEADARALETTERVLAALRLLPERDASVEALIERIDDDRAHLLAAIIGGQSLGRATRRVRRPILVDEPPHAAVPPAV